MNKVLAQDEVDALLRGLSGGEIENETETQEDDSGIVSFDLANQDRIIRGRMATALMLPATFWTKAVISSALITLTPA